MTLINKIATIQHKKHKIIDNNNFYLYENVSLDYRITQLRRLFHGKTINLPKHYRQSLVFHTKYFVSCHPITSTATSKKGIFLPFFIKKLFAKANMLYIFFKHDMLKSRYLRTNVQNIRKHSMENLKVKHCKVGPISMK